MKYILTILVCCSFCVKDARAQFTYTIDQSIPVINQAGSELLNSWTGGMNAAQFNTIHLDNDNKEDLVLFDRTSNRVITFLNIEGKWKYAPDYEAIFPDEVTNWLLLRDFDCDGRKDIFTGDTFGVKVYKNLGKDQSYPLFERVVFPGLNGTSTNILLTLGFSGKVNIQLQYDDLPAIVDADGDGDLDLFNVRFTGNGSVEFHKNFSVERTGRCGLDLERQTQTWGGVTQCKCDNFAYDNATCGPSSGRVQHAGGKALLAIDLDGDKDHELLFSESECSNLYALVNEGTLSAPDINSNSRFPTSRPVDINIFPAAFYEDVDMDGLKDLVASPNIYRKDILTQDLKASTWFYRNTGNTSIPDFTYVKSNFLQEGMIDVGDNSVPAFDDLDGDGDLDLLVSNNSDASGFGSITLYRNTGNSERPALKWETDDFISTKSLKLSGLRIQVKDVDGDKVNDLIVMGTDEQAKTNLFYMLGDADIEGRFSIADLTKINFSITSLDNYHLTDVDRDGRLDLLVGKFNGSLEYWRSVGFLSFVLQESEFLGIGSSTSFQSFSIFCSDLDNDGNEDMILADQFGKIRIIDNYRSSTIMGSSNDILYNPLLEGYRQPAFGKSWATVAPIFKSARPAIVLGNIRGGLIVLKSEDKDLRFEELILKLYPNPSTDGTVTVESNFPLTLDIYNATGQVVDRDVMINHGVTTLSMSALASGMYLLHFHNSEHSVSRKLIVR